MTPEAGLLVGEALHELGGFVEADTILTTAEETVVDDDELLVQIAEMRSRNLMWGLRRNDEAVEVNNRARDRLQDPQGIEELTMNEAMLLTYSGRPLDGLAVLARRDPSPPTPHRAMHALAEVPALIMAGRCESGGGRNGALRRAVGAAGSDRHPRPGRPHHPPGVGPGRVWPAGRRHRPRRGRLRGHAGHRSARRLHVARPSAGSLRAAVRPGRQRPAVARRGARPVRGAQHHRAAPARALRLATAHAYAGDADAAAEAVRDLERLPAFVRPEQEMGRAGRAWRPAISRAGGSCSRRRPIGRRDSGHYSTEAWLLHDIARIGDRPRWPIASAGWPRQCEGGWWPPTPPTPPPRPQPRRSALVDAADGFERLGAMLLAAEAATDAAQAYQRAGDRRGGGRARGCGPPPWRVLRGRPHAGSACR